MLNDYIYNQISFIWFFLEFNSILNWDPRVSLLTFLSALAGFNYATNINIPKFIPYCNIRSYYAFQFWVNLSFSSGNSLIETSVLRYIDELFLLLMNWCSVAPDMKLTQNSSQVLAKTGEQHMLRISFYVFMSHQTLLRFMFARII